MNEITGKVAKESVNLKEAGQGNDKEYSTINENGWTCRMNE